jgi:hypothetical protein
MRALFLKVIIHGALYKKVAILKTWITIRRAEMLQQMTDDT